MNFKRIHTIFRKELVDGLRDRRALLSVLIFPFFGPLLIVFMLNTITNSDEAEQAIELPVIGQGYAPELIDTLSRNGINIVDPPSDHQAAIQEGNFDIILEVQADYGEKFQASEPANVILHYDESRTAARQNIRQVQGLINAYGAQISSIRLLMRGIDPAITTPIMLQHHDLSTPQTKAANLFETIIMFSVLSAFVCGMYLAIDSTAGERERGSLEPLLLTPTPRRELLIGKWSASAVFSTFGVVMTLSCTAISLSFVPLELIGVRLVLGVPEVITILFAFVPLALFAAAIQLLVASFAKSFKEAQTYLNMTMFLPMAPGLILSFKPMLPALWMAAIPALSQQLTASSILRGEPLAHDFWLLALTSTFFLTGICLWLATRLFKDETFFFKQ